MRFETTFGRPSSARGHIGGVGNRNPDGTGQSAEVAYTFRVLAAFIKPPTFLKSQSSTEGSPYSVVVTAGGRARESVCLADYGAQLRVPNV